MARSRTAIAEEKAAGKAQLDTAHTRRRRIGCAIVAAAALAVSGWLGWQAKTASLPDQARVVQAFHGTVDFVDGSGYTGCFVPDSGSRQCGEIYRDAKLPALEHGDKVDVAIVSLDQGNGSSIEVMVVSPRD